ncbi:MAG: phasin family protein [Noviherbaspirillum sp.]
MYSIQEQFKTDALAQLNSKVRDAQLIAGNMLELSREIGVLNVRTTKASAEMLAGAVQKLLGASNPGEFFQLAASVMRSDMQVWASYAEQLRSIAGKMTAPLAAVPVTAAAAGYAHAPAAAPEAEATAAPEEETPAAPVAPEPAAEEAAAEAEAAAAPAATAGEPVAEPPLAAARPEPETPELIKDVAEAMAGMSKAPAVVLAAYAPLKAQAVASAPAAAKASLKPASRKAPVRHAPQKAGPPARPGAKRGKKS